MPFISPRSIPLAARRAVCLGLVGAAAACGRDRAADTRDSTAAAAQRLASTATAVVADTTARTEPSWCSEVPRAANTKLPRVDVRSDWYEVYQVDSGVYAITEPRQFQEVISYLIVGTRSALLFDSGLGMVPIRPVVQRLTTLPVRVLNSHTHYDHVGGNAEFDDVLARDTPYTRNNQRGFAHAELASEVAPASFCTGAPAALDTATYRTRPWRATHRVADGDTLDLGGRVLEVIAVPGHTPDATALLDRGRRLLFTGDTYYDAHVWLFVPETDLDAYERSIARLVALAPSVRTLLPAHNTAAADPARLPEMQQAIRMVRDGAVRGRAEGGLGVTYHFPHFAILTSPAVLDGRARNTPTSGSGLTTYSEGPSATAPVKP
ncbi:MAG TPA: MBL fold metallo-hydrolase [Gemmatimonadaceae bacterium]|nr:MBL fold metallo-hydrolase [Gemmatimonadaceae bacterium]